jgi:hypothetical protein
MVCRGVLNNCFPGVVDMLSADSRAGNDGRLAADCGERRDDLGVLRGVTYNDEIRVTP